MNFSFNKHKSSRHSQNYNGTVQNETQNANSKKKRDGSVQRFPSWSVYVNLALIWLVWTVADVQGL